MESLRSHHRTGRTVDLVAGVCAMIAVAGPAASQPSNLPAVQGCHIQGSWLGQDGLVGAEFFIQFGGGVNATSGPITVEWTVTPSDFLTLGGSFTGAVGLTSAAGEWRKNATSYDYTFVYYGLDGAGNRLYAIRASGTDSFVGCNTLNYSGNLELFAPPDAFPWPLDDTPVGTVGDFGVKERVSP